MSDIVANMIRIADAARRPDGSDIPLGEQCREAADEITRLCAEVERLRAALKPFADRADRYDPHEDNDDQEPDWSTAAPDIRIGDLRRAREALNGGERT